MENVKQVVFVSSLHNFAMRNTGEYKIDLEVSEKEFPNVIPIVKYILKPIVLTMKVDKTSVVIKNSFLFRFQVNTNGDSRVIFTVSNDDVGNEDLFDLINNCVNKNIAVIVEG